ncbi:MAG: AMIN domain-containing protein [Elusimicrobiota bacterium]|nr:AMIN domain-containing protein [Elusimicrobiota bacterium]MDH5661454.1 AMIN domain-containing protein [Elusimicrobiota bacterium]
MKKLLFPRIVFILVLGLVWFVNAGPVAQEENPVPEWEELTNVKVQKISETKSNIIITTSGPIKYHCFRITNPPRLVVEMTNTVHNWKEKELEVGDFLLKRIRSGQYQNEPVKITRVVLDLERSVEYEATATEEQIILTIFAKEAVEKVEKEVPKVVRKAERVKRPRIIKKKVTEIEPNIQNEEHRRLVEKIKKEEKERKPARRAIEEERRPVAIGEVMGSISQDMVSLDFVDADISEVIRFFALKTEMNLVLADDVKGEVTIHLRNVPFDEALKTILEQKGLIGIQHSENVIKILDKSKMPTYRKTFSLQNVNAAEFKDTIDKALTEEEKTYTTVSVADVTNALIITSTAEGIEKLSALIEELDVKKPQIRIAAKIMEVDITKDVDLGIDWTVTKTFAGSDQIGDTTVTGNVENMASPFSLGTPTTLNIATIISGADLDLTLKALAKKTDARTLSNPTLVVENNRPAHIHVGDSIPYKETLVTAAGAAETTRQLEIGTTLDVTPAVSPTGNQISMDVNVAVKDFVGFTAAGPQTTDRSATTKVTISEGQTVVVGGLVSETEKGTAYQVPILGDIPILGYLFKRKETHRRTLELLIFLTPHVMRD